MPPESALSEPLCPPHRMEKQYSKSFCLWYYQRATIEERRVFLIRNSSQKYFLEILRLWHHCYHNSNHIHPQPHQFTNTSLVNIFTLLLIFTLIIFTLILIFTLIITLRKSSYMESFPRIGALSRPAKNN